MKRIPFISFLIGISSCIPLIVMALFILIYPASIPLQVLMVSFVAYAAVILAFTGGVNWILAMQKPVIFLKEEHGKINGKRLWLSVLPCVIGETTVVLAACHHELIALGIQIVSFLFISSYEGKFYMASEVPGGYMILRRITTSVIVVCLIGVSLSRIF